jgi:hypothetical protein
MGSNNSNETNIIDNTKLRVFSEGLSVLDTGKIAMQIRSLGLENDGRSRQLARYIKEVGERYVDNMQVVMIYRNDRFLRGGDHTAFVENGYAGVRFTEMNENYTRQHQDVRTENGIAYGDLPEHIDFEYLRKNSGVNLANLSNLAKAPAIPDDVKVEVKKEVSKEELEKKIELQNSINELKKKRDRMEENKRMYEVDIDLYNKFKKIQKLQIH